MPKGMYIGINNIARKAKKGYIGIDNVARKIKKAYIGIGGVARPCWNSGTSLQNYGLIEPLAVATSNLAATSTDDYAFFAGGYDPDITNPPAYKTVNTYDSGLTRMIATDMIVGLMDMAATRILDRAVFAGGGIKPSQAQKLQYSHFALITAYQPDLTQIFGGNLTFARSEMGCTKIDTNTLLGGGNGWGTSYRTMAAKAVELLDYGLTTIVAPDLDSEHMGPLAGSINNMYALFAGGLTVDGAYNRLVEVYSNDLIKLPTAELPGPIIAGWGGSLPNYAIFKSGSVLLAYDSDLTYTEIGLTLHGIPAATGSASLSLGNLVIISGGYNRLQSPQTFTVNNDLEISIQDNLIVPRDMHAMAAIGNYALVAGGMSVESTAATSAALDSVEAYEIQL